MGASAEAKRTDGSFARLARDSALYALGGAVGKLVAIALLPFLARALTPAELGRVDVLSALQSTAASLLLLGLDLAATRLFADLGEIDRRRLFATWLALTVALVLPLAAALTAFAGPIGERLFDAPGYGSAVAFTALAIVGSVVQLVALTALRNHGRALAYAAISGGTLLLNGIAVAVLVTARPRAASVTGAMAASMATGAVAALLVARHALAGRPSGELGRRLLRIGLPAVPAVAATWIAELANRAILLERAGADEVAFFGIAARFSSLAVLVVLGFQMAWQPAAFGLGTDRAALERIADDGRRIVAAVAIAVVVVAAVAPELVLAIGGEPYRGATRAVGFGLVFAVGYAAYHTASMPSAISRRFRDLGISASVGAVAGIALNAWWAGRWGAWGTSAAVAVGQFAGAATAIAFARARVAVPYAWGRLGVIVAAASAATLAATFPAPPPGLALRAGLVLAFVVVVVVEGSGPDLVRSFARQRASRATASP